MMENKYLSLMPLYGRGIAGLSECIVCGNVMKKNQDKCPVCGASQNEDDDY
jgi:rubrerythrin